MQMSGDRRRAHVFKAERQAAFSKKVRQGYLDDGRKLKDAERSRMEAYRRLCEQEGITSKRLEEYDRTREAASETLGKRLEQVDYDQSLTNNEKKRRKYNLKRKFSATTVNDLMAKKQRRYNAVVGAEVVQKKREEERVAKVQARVERETNKRDRLMARKSNNARFAKRTARGQPIMSSRVESLLEKIAR